MPVGIYRRTKNHCQKISDALKGHPGYWEGKHRSEETKKKLSVAMKGCKSPVYGKHLSKGTRKKMSEVHKGHLVSEETRKKLSEANKGHLVSEETKKKISEANKGERCNFWKGGITPLEKKIRNSKKYNEWRLMVFGRDDFTCQKCRKRGVYLEAHHLKRFSEIVSEFRIKTFEQALTCEELWNINNGETLCKKCHRR